MFELGAMDELVRINFDQWRGAADFAVFECAELAITINFVKHRARSSQHKRKIMRMRVKIERAVLPGNRCIECVDLSTQCRPCIDTVKMRTVKRRFDEAVRNCAVGNQICKKCLVEKSTDQFRRGRNTTIMCADCRAIITKRDKANTIRLFEQNAALSPGMQICKLLCGEISSAFFASSNSHRCRMCHYLASLNSRNKSEIKKRKERLRELLAAGCACGGPGHEFDHIDPATKIEMVTMHTFWLANKSEEEWIAEIDKCIVVCVRCHIDKTRNSRPKRKLTGKDIRIAQKIEFAVVVDIELWKIPSDQRARWHHDHRNRTEKFKNVSDLIYNASSIRMVADEMMKCDRLTYEEHKLKTKMDHVRLRIAGRVPVEGKLTKYHIRFNDYLLGARTELAAYDASVAAHRLATNYPSIERQHEVINRIAAEFEAKYPNGRKRVRVTT
jgi:hypothetical protein